jgi:methionyl-tRNA formyltransferase
MPHPLRLVFMGTPDFSVPALKALRQAGHEIPAVYCQPPKPAGRGQQLRETPVHRAALELGIVVRCPKSLKSAEEQQKLADLAPDLIVVAAYGLILPQAVLDIPRLGCVNIHASLLPRWRGAAPIQRAILAGDRETGVTLMQMEAGLDTGPMLLKKSLPITNETTGESLHDALSALGAEMIGPAVDDLANSKMKATPQPEEGATYAAKLTKEEGKIDWAKSAEEIDRQIRAFTPWPGAFFFNGREAIKLIQASVVSGHGSAGELLSDDFTVACGHGALRLQTVQRAGKKAADAPSVLRGMRLDKGHVFS